MKKAIKAIKARPVLSIIGIIAIILAFFYFFSGKKSNSFTTTTVALGNITQEVTVTGKTKPVDDVSLAFERSGKIIRVGAKIGDAVEAGSILVQLDTSELATQLLQAEANLEVQQAKLAELKRGIRPEDIRIKETELQKAEQDITNEYDDVVNTLNDAYAKTEDALRKQTADLFSGSDERDPQITFVLDDSRIEQSAETQRADALTELSQWRIELNTLSVISPSSTLDRAIENAKGYLVSARDALTYAMDAVNHALNLASATVSAYKANITTARTNVNTGLTNVNAQEHEIVSKFITAQRIRDELGLKLAGSTSEELAAQDAQVKQAQAQMQNIQVQIGKMALRSPIKGVVTKQDAKIGQVIAASIPIVSVISENNLEIEANIPEVDIAKIAVGNTAAVTLDAYGPSVKFDATVASIDPAEVMIDGVATYRTILQFSKKDARVRPGMTANVDILSARRDNVLVMPERAITINDNGTKTVVILRGGTAEEATIETGLRGSDGNIEIVRGLKEGDQVVTYTQEK